MEHKHYNFYIIKTQEIKDELAEQHKIRLQEMQDRQARLKSQLLEKGIEVEAIAVQLANSFNLNDGIRITGIFSKTILPGWKKQSDYRDEENRYHIYPKMSDKAGKELAAIFGNLEPHIHYFADHYFLEENGLECGQQRITNGGIACYNTMLIQFKEEPDQEYLLLVPKKENSELPDVSDEGLEFIEKNCEQISAGQYIDNYASQKMFHV